MTRRWNRALAALGLAAAHLAACAGPLAVTAATSKDSRVRFAYQQLGTTNSGIINCNVAASGDLEGCQHQRVLFIEQRKPGGAR
jgi:hypothetical protein